MRKLVPVTAFALCGFSCLLQGQDDVTFPGDPITAARMIGGVFVLATEGTPAGNPNMFPTNGLSAFAMSR